MRISLQKEILLTSMRKVISLLSFSVACSFWFAFSSTSTCFQQEHFSHQTLLSLSHLPFILIFFLFGISAFVGESSRILLLVLFVKSDLGEFWWVLLRLSFFFSRKMP